MPDDIMLRYACQKDIADARKLFVEVVADLELYNEWARTSQLKMYNEEHLAEMVEEDPQAILMAYVGDDAAGFAFTSDEHNVIMLEWYGVSPRHTRKGIARRLLKRLLADAPARKASRYWCDTRTTNTASMALLEDLGFERFATLENHWYGQDFYLWKKDFLQNNS